MIKPWVRFESVEENREGYFVTYSPVGTDNNLAVLVVSFYEEVTQAEAVHIMESELRVWIAKYPTPLMVMPSTDFGGSVLRLNKFKGNGFVLGYPEGNGEIVVRWESVPNEDYEEFVYSQEALMEMYDGISFRTSSDAEKDIQKRVLQNKALIAVTLFWLCIVPGTIAYLGFASPYVSICVFVYSLHKAVIKGLELTGRLRPLPEDIEKAEKERIKEHHHYHCELNPEGFNRLKLANLKRDRKERNNEKLERVKKLTRR